MPPRMILYYNDLAFSPSEFFLSRDFGQVPYVLADLHGLDLEYWIAASRPNPGFDGFRGKPVRQFGKSLAALPRRLDILKNLRLYREIRRARNLTHFVLFPFTPVTDWLVARMAKRGRPGLKLIVKLDANAEFLADVAADWALYGPGRARRTRQSHYYRELLKLADAVICETGACEAILRNGFLGLALDGKLAKTFSGVSDAWLTSLGVRAVPPNQRRASIVVSGRISIPIKHTGLIFEAGPPPPGWTIEFVGEVDEELKRTIAAHRAADPLFDERYRFHGVIADKRAYYHILMRSRALLMNSRGPEGFPNVYADAHYCGLFILTSDIAAAADATDGGRFGAIYPRGEAAALRAALAALPALADDYGGDPALGEHRKRFVWEHSLDQPAIRSLFDGSSKPSAGRAAA